MENEKKFSNEMFGYDKREVEEYIKAMKAEYESKIQAEKSDANRIANELTILKRKLEKYETENIKLLKNYGLMHPDAVKPRPFYDLRQMLEGPAYYYFKQIDEVDLIDVIVRVAIGKHREWIHNRNIDKV